MLHDYLRGLAMFHDKDFHHEAIHGPGLITGVSKLGALRTGGCCHLPLTPSQSLVFLRIPS